MRQRGRREGDETCKTLERVFERKENDRHSRESGNLVRKVLILPSPMFQSLVLSTIIRVFVVKIVAL